MLVKTNLLYRKVTSIKKIIYKRQITKKVQILKKAKNMSMNLQSIMRKIISKEELEYKIVH